MLIVPSLDIEIKRSKEKKTSAKDLNLLDPQHFPGLHGTGPDQQYANPMEPNLTQNLLKMNRSL